MTDLISRADAIKTVIRMCSPICDWQDGTQQYPDCVVAEINALPSADAEQGEWVIRENGNKECSLCGHERQDGWDYFCGYCGARMKGRQNADKTQTMNDQHTVDHDRDWIIGCIEHDGFIKTDRFDKANQIILDALSAEAETKCIAQIKVDTEEIVRRIKEEYDITDRWIPCSERLPKRDELVLVTYKTTDRIHLCKYLDDGSENPWWSYIDDCCACNNVVIAWMPLPKPYECGARMKGGAE